MFLSCYFQDISLSLFWKLDCHVLHVDFAGFVLFGRFLSFLNPFGHTFCQFWDIFYHNVFESFIFQTCPFLLFFQDCDGAKILDLLLQFHKFLKFYFFSNLFSLCPSEGEISLILYPIHGSFTPLSTSLSCEPICQIGFLFCLLYFPSQNFPVCSSLSFFLIAEAFY